MAEKNNDMVLGVDLGGTKILTAVVDTQGNLITRDHSVTPAQKGPHAVIQAIAESADRVLDQAGLTISDMAAIGIGAPGPSNPQRGILYTSPNLPGWEDFPLTDVLEKQFGPKAFLINDANAAGLAECHFGAAKGARNAIYITISTGIGGGIIIDRRIYTGASGAAGEVGHMTIDHNGPMCNCGNRGCWETLGSGTALARDARRKIEEGLGGSILNLAAGNINNVTAEIVQKAAQQGDETAIALIQQAGYYIGVGLANLINLFSPEIIVIGGGLSNMGDMLLAPAYQTASERAFDVMYQSVRFVPAQLGRDSGVLGAAAYAFEEMGCSR